MKILGRLPSTLELTYELIRPNVNPYTFVSIPI